MHPSHASGGVGQNRPHLPAPNQRGRTRSDPYRWEDVASLPHSGGGSADRTPDSLARDSKIAAFRDTCPPRARQVSSGPLISTTSSKPEDSIRLSRGEGAYRQVLSAGRRLKYQFRLPSGAHREGALMTPRRRPAGGPQYEHGDVEGLVGGAAEPLLLVPVTEQQPPHHALQFRHATCGSLALSIAIAFCSAVSALSKSAPLAAGAAALALLTLSTSTVNLMASVAAFVRR